MNASKMPARLPIAAVMMALGAIAGCDCGSKPDATPAPPAPTNALPYGLTPEQSKAPVLRLANGHTVTLGEFAARLGPAPLTRNRPPETQRRTEFLETLVTQELLAAEAEARGLADKPVDQVRQAALVQVAMDRLFGPQGELVEPVTDEVVRAAYDADPARFTALERRRVSHILIASEPAARLLLQQLQAAADVPKAFHEAALRQTQDMRTRGVRGDLGYFTAVQPPAPEPGTDAMARPSMRLASELPQPIRDAAFKMDKVGELLGELVQTDKGFHLLLLTGKQGGQQIPFQQVQRALKTELIEERQQAAMEKLVAKLEAAAKPVHHEENLDLVRVSP